MQGVVPAKFRKVWLGDGTVAPGIVQSCVVLWWRGVEWQSIALVLHSLAEYGIGIVWLCWFGIVAAWSSADRFGDGEVGCGNSVCWRGVVVNSHVRHSLVTVWLCNVPICLGIAMYCVVQRWLSQVLLGGVSLRYRRVKRGHVTSCDGAALRRNALCRQSFVQCSYVEWR